MDLKDVKKQIKELIHLIQDTAVSELELEREGVRIKIKKDDSVPEHSHGASIFQGEGAPQAQLQLPTSTEEKLERDNGLFIRSPIVGTFYRSPAPDASPYVELGDIVKKGQVVCVIEAMKLMNEIESDTDGKIAEILVENSQPVEYGEPLFRIERRVD